MSAPQRNRTQMIAIAVGRVALVLFSLATAWGQSLRPIVVTNFIIESPKHKSNFKPDAARRQFELRIAAELARLCQERFGFLKWLPVDPANGSPGPAAALTLSLIAGRGNFPPVVLHYTAAVSGQPHQTGIDDAELFGGFDDQFSNDHPRLESTLVAKLREQFANDAFRKDLHEGLLGQIPLASRVILQAPQVIVPVNFEELTPSDESVLVVQFRARPGGAQDVGSALLVPLGDIQGSLSCLIQSLNSATVVINQKGDWNPGIVLLMEPPTVESLNVFMRVYKQRPNPGTEGALSTRPE
jgi:hypothetical protein